MELTGKRRCWLVLGAEGGEEMVPKAGETEKRLEANEEGVPGSVASKHC